MNWDNLENIIETVMCRPVIIRYEEKTAKHRDTIVLDLYDIRKEAGEKSEKDILREITVILANFNMLWPYQNEIYDESYDRIITSLFREYFKEYFK